VKVLVDTAVWSLAFRRNHPAKGDEAHELRRLAEKGSACIVGPIRQELLSGIADPKQFDFLRELLSAFADEVLVEADFELAARFYNQCRKKGIQGNHTDFLICAVAHRRNMAIFSTDKDFRHYAKVVQIQLYDPLQHNKETQH
jgi:predicted nucleic acid-binding protein